MCQLYFVKFFAQIWTEILIAKRESFTSQPQAKNVE